MIRDDLLDDPNYLKLVIQLREDQFQKRIKLKQFFSGLGKKIITCDCGKESTLNGLTSHKRVCEQAFITKSRYLKEQIQTIIGETKCPVCDSEIEVDYQEIRNLGKINLITCCKQCTVKLNTIESLFNKIDICPICEREYVKDRMNRKTCSDECKSKHLSNIVTNYHKADEFKDSREKRKTSLRNSNNSGWFKKDKPPWNKGLTGEEYISHYLNDDGTYRLKQVDICSDTSIEKKVHKFIHELELTHQKQYSFKFKWYDFYIELENFILMIETDGDYWHCNSKTCFDPNKIKSIRHYDSYKTNLIESWVRQDNKPVKLIRFWETDINNNFEFCKESITKLVEYDKKGMTNEFTSTIQKIKEHYIKSS